MLNKNVFSFLLFGIQSFMKLCRIVLVHVQNNYEITKLMCVK